MTSRAQVPRGRIGRYVGALGCFLGALCLYLASLAPTVQGFDSAELTVGAYTLGFIHAPGYPLYLMIGHLFTYAPIGDVGMRLNLMSSLFGSLTVLVLYWLLLLHTGEWLVSSAAAALFATAPIFWSQAIRAEVYTLHTLLAAGALLAWLQATRSGRIGTYLVCFVLLGLGMANHPTTALLWGSILLFGLPSPRWRKASIAGTLLGLVVTAACYSYFPVRSLAPPPVDYIGAYFRVDPGNLKGLWWLISARMFRCLFYLDHNWSAILEELARLGRLVWYNLLGVGLVLGGWGWWRAGRFESSWNRLLSIYYLANLAMFLSYRAVDKEVMFIPIFLVATIWVAGGIQALASWLASRLEQLDLNRASSLASLVLLSVIACAVLLNWTSVSLRGNRRAYEFASTVLDQVPDSAIVVNSWSTAPVIDYLQIVEGRRPDLANFNLGFFLLASQTECDPTGDTLKQAWLAWLGSRLGTRPICAIEPLPVIAGNLRWVQEGVCWTVASLDGNR